MTGTHDRAGHSDPDSIDRVEAILHLLRRDGGRVTTGRRAIVTALLTAADHHLTADAVTGIVQAEHPDIHLSTIYRTLEALEQHGVVDRVNLGQSDAVYHLTDHVHHHLVCVECGAVLQLDDDAVAGLAAELRRRLGFTLSSHNIALSGRCRTCSTD